MKYLKNKKLYIFLLIVIAICAGGYALYKKASLKEEIKRIEEYYITNFSRKKFIKSSLKELDIHNKSDLYRYMDGNFDRFLSANEALDRVLFDYANLYADAFDVLNAMKFFSLKNRKEIKNYLLKFNFGEAVNTLKYINLNSNSNDDIALVQYFTGIVRELNFQYDAAKNAYMAATRLNPYNLNYYNALGKIYYRLYDFRSAVNAFEGGLNASNKMAKRDKSMEMKILYNLSRTYYIMNNKEQAFKNYANLLIDAVSTDNKKYEWKAIYNMAIIEAELGNYATAIENLKFALKISTKMRNRQYIAKSLNALSKVYYKYGNYENGKKNGLKAIKYAKKSSNIQLVADASLNTCLNYDYVYSTPELMEKKKEMVNIYCGRAIKINSLLAKLLLRPEFYNKNGYIYNYISIIADYQKSLENYNFGLELSSFYNLLLDKINSLYGIANDLMFFDKNKMAINKLNEAYNIENKLGINNSITYNYTMGLINWDMKKYNAALSYYGDALFSSKNANNNYMISLTASHIASIYYEMGDYKKAFFYSNQSLETNKKMYRYDHHYIKYQSNWNRGIMDKMLNNKGKQNVRKNK